jgi:hypothetical protein
VERACVRTDKEGDPGSVVACGEGNEGHVLPRSFSHSTSQSFHVGD